MQFSVDHIKYVTWPYLELHTLVMEMLWRFYSTKCCSHPVCTMGTANCIDPNLITANDVLANDVPDDNVITLWAVSGTWDWAEYCD